MTRQISARTVTLLCDLLSDYWVLATIERLFNDEAIDLGPESAGARESGQRRGLARQFLASLDLQTPADERKLIGVYNTVLAELADRADGNEWAAKDYQRLTSYLRRDGFSVDAGTNRIVNPGFAVEEAQLSSLPDASAIRENLHRLTDNVDTDPRAAVGAAKDLVESTAKVVLSRRGVPYSTTEKLPALISKAQASLRLHPGGVAGDDQHEARALKTILGSLTQLAQGVVQLRNKVGAGHGRESVPTWVRPRHARLAAGAAQVWVQLMLETLDDPQARWRREP